MKLIALLSLGHETKALSKLFDKVKLPVYSEMEIKGFRKNTIEEAPAWFATKALPAFSNMHFVFIEDEQADQLMETIAAFNSAEAGNRPIHAFQMGVEKAI